MEEFDIELFCPACGEGLVEWNMGIYECKSDGCDIMVDISIFEDD